MQTFISTSRKLSLSAILLLLSFIGFANSKDESGPPNVVELSFAQRFPNASGVKWEKSTKGQNAMYVEFKYERKKTKAYFDKNGSLLEIQKEVKVKDLPQSVKKAIAKSYPTERVLKAQEIIRAGKDPVYQIVLEIENQQTNFMLDKEGSFTMR